MRHVVTLRLMWLADSEFGIGPMRQSSRPTLKAIARQLGVSATTMSRVLNGKAAEHGISRKTEEGVVLPTRLVKRASVRRIGK